MIRGIFASYKLFKLFNCESDCVFYEVLHFIFCRPLVFAVKVRRRIRVKLNNKLSSLVKRRAGEKIEINVVKSVGRTVNFKCTERRIVAEKTVVEVVPVFFPFPY